MTPTVKNLPAMLKTRVQSELGRSPGDLLEKEMAILSSILA